MHKSLECNKKKEATLPKARDQFTSSAFWADQTNPQVLYVFTNMYLIRLFSVLHASQNLFLSLFAA